MEVPDIWLIICSHLSDRELAIISHTPIWTLISPLIKTQFWWRLRVQHTIAPRLDLTMIERECHSPSQSRCWRNTYRVVLGHERQSNPFVVATDELSVRVLLGLGVDPSQQGNAAIRMATYCCSVDVVRALLSDPRVAPDECNPTCLYTACQWDEPELVRLLLDDGRSDPRAEHKQALRRARELGRDATVQLLLADERMR